MKARLILSFLVVFVGWVIWEENTGRFNTFVMLADMIPLGDKMVHFTVMGSIALLANLSLNYRSVALNHLNIPVGSLIVLCVATAEEFSQLNFPTRDFELLDLAMNYLGIACFTYFGMQYHQQQQSDKLEV